MGHTGKRTFRTLQKALVQRQRRRMLRSIRQTAELVSYQRRYDQETSSFAVPSFPGELAEHMAGSDVIYVGDFHTLLQSQKLFVRLVKLARHRVDPTRPLLLALELFRAKDQLHVDAYLAGHTDFDELLEAVDYPHTWGFPPDGYRLILEYARASGISVIGINSNPRVPKNRLLKRDQFAARKLVQRLRQWPMPRIMVLIGDLHVALEHLPAAVEEEGAKSNLACRQLRIHTNPDAIFWQLSSLGLDYMVNITKLESGAFAVTNATPLAKYESYLRYLEGVLDDEETLDGGLSSGSLLFEEHLLDFAQHIGEFLSIPFERQEDFEVVVSADEMSGDREAVKQAHDWEELEVLATATALQIPVFMPHGWLLIHRLDLNEAADCAARILLRQYQWVAPFDATVKEFHQLLIMEALAYFAAKAINPKLTCKREADLEKMVQELSLHPQRNPGTQFMAEVARDHALPHLLRVREHVVEGLPYNDTKASHRLGLRKRLLMARLVGRRLGEKLFYAAHVGAARKVRNGELLSDWPTIKDIAGWITRTPASIPNMKAFYLEICGKAASVTEHHDSRSSWF